MKRFHLIGSALIAVSVFSVFMAGSAFAATVFLLAEWLLNGAPVAAANTVEVEYNELELEDDNVPVIGRASVLCSLLFTGWVGPNSLDYVSEVLNLKNEKISLTPLVGLELECTPHVGCEANTVAEVWLVGLPWESEVELMEQETPVKEFFADLLFKVGGGTFGWEVTNCLVLGVVETDVCEGTELAAELRLEKMNSLGNFSTAFTLLAETKFPKCTQGGAESGDIEGEGLFIPAGGGELAASSGSSVS